MNKEIDRVGQLVEHGRTLFAGEEPEVVGAALADLLAIWITSHRSDTINHTSHLRAALLRFHFKGVRQLIAFYSRKETR